MLKMTKIKLILLAVFIAINAFFIYAYISSETAARANREALLGDTLQILASKNITVSGSSLPDLPTTLPLYTAVNSLASKSDISSALLGEDCYMLDVNFFQNAESNLFVNGGRFDLYPQNAPTTAQPGRGVGGAAAKAQATQWAKKHGLWTKTSKVLGTSKDDFFNQPIVAIADKLGKYIVLDSYLNIWVGTDESSQAISKNSVMHAAGRNWLATSYTEIPDSATPIMRLPTLMVNFANSRTVDSPLDIMRVEFGYFLGDREQMVKEVTARPAVRLVTTDGEIYIDANTGSVLE